jgi:HAD superfamily hydrolase (TIGR01509 family)
MPKLVVFDLDGVLVDSCTIHYETLNEALVEIVGPSARISEADHERDYNGLSTRMKLKKMDLEETMREAVFVRKQELTHKAMATLPANLVLHSAISLLRARGLAIWCASNCIRATVELALASLGIRDLFDGVLSNEDVAYPKPAPDMYLRCMELAGVGPSETLIFEDSYRGLTAAVASGARVWRVASASEMTADGILAAVDSSRSNLMRSVNIVIPMAGNGSRFATAGYKDPKPFIPVFGSPMISWVVRNLGVDASYTFIIRKEFEKTYSATEYLQKICPGCSVIAIDAVTEGAACTVLKAKETINANAPLVIINSDQYIEFENSPNAFQMLFDFLYSPEQKDLAGLISTFDGARNPKWSYAKTDDRGVVTEVREKDPFSDHATTGLYVWRKGSDFVTYAEKMIGKNIRVNNEFYVVPVFNEAIADGRQFGLTPCKQMWGIGVPEDLEFFLSHFKHAQDDRPLL